MILQQPRKLTFHPTAAGSRDASGKQLFKISREAVYRNPGLLAQNLSVQKLDMAGFEVRLDGKPGRLCHAGCGVSGRVEDHLDRPCDPPRRQIREGDGRVIHGFGFEFEGTLPRYRGKH